MSNKMQLALVGSSSASLGMFSALETATRMALGDHAVHAVADLPDIAKGGIATLTAVSRSHIAVGRTELAARGPFPSREALGASVKVRLFPLSRMSEFVVQASPLVWDELDDEDAWGQVEVVVTLATHAEPLVLTRPVLFRQRQAGADVPSLLSVLREASNTNHLG